MKLVSLALILTAIAGGPLWAQTEHTLVRRLAVFPLKTGQPELAALADEAWWELREALTKDKRFLVASKNFLMQKDVYQARSVLSPADAIILAAIKPGVDGEIFNVVDDERWTSKEFLAARKEAKNFFSMWAPYPLIKFGCGVWEDFSKKRHGQLPAVFNRRRCAAEWGGNTFSNEKLHKLLGWSPKIKTVDAVKLFLAQYK